MADEEHQESHLFGGAFSARLPPGSLDISEMRQVPDNQEVFVHPSTDQSIIVELLEYQAGVADENAASFSPWAVLARASAPKTVVGFKYVNNRFSAWIPLPEVHSGPRFHFEDIVGNSANSEVLSQTQFAPALLSFEGCSSSWQLVGHQQVAKFNEEAKNDVSVHLVLLRLPQYGTDLLVTFNDPTWINPLSTSAAQSTEVPLALSQPPWTVENFHAFVCSLRLLDPGLFG